MSWLSNFTPPGVKKMFQKRDTPDNLWIKCKSCGDMIFHRDYEIQQHVCGNCGHHMRIAPLDRYPHLFDDGAFDLVPTPDVVQDPLKFKDEKRYSDRLRDARKKTGAQDAVSIAVGALEGVRSVVFGQNFGFMGGSLGMAAGEAIVAAADKALELGAPLIGITAAGGARMQEGILSLMQMPRTTLAIQRLREAGLPYIVVLTDPTTGGVTASYAMLGDVHLAEPGALIGFAGPRVIEQTIREKLPEGFQRSEYLFEHGMVDAVVTRTDLRAALGRILRHLTGAAPMPENGSSTGAPAPAA